MLTARRHHFRLHEAFDRSEPADENEARRSSVASYGVLLSVKAPTVITYGTLPGTEMVIGLGPSLPADTTTTMPRTPGRHHGLIQRIVPVVRLRRRAERKVEHANLVLRRDWRRSSSRRRSRRCSDRTFAVERSHQHEIRTTARYRNSCR